ncbi:MAG TPA: hydrogenase maturation protease [Anaerolineales bacterium]|nr:hydrogenase maturation protease [Anaerolineales bacterium]
MNKILLIGYGNPDRQDDGVAWHVLHELAIRLNLPVPDSYEDEFPLNDRLDFAFYLQLTPEMAEDLANYERVCFVDAHTGSVAREVNFQPIQGEFQHSPFTHHLTPQSLLSMCKTLYKKMPEAALLSVRGYQFEFERMLSAETAALVPRAVDVILEWLEKK